MALVVRVTCSKVTCSKGNSQHMTRESVKSCLWDKLTCVGTDIGTWLCDDVRMDCVTWFFASGRYMGGVMGEGVAVLFC
jgi:hypothetical protein